jgi:hypothetical protein
VGTPAITPAPPSGPDQGPGGGAPPQGMAQMAGDQNFLDPAKKLAKLAVDAKDIAEAIPSSAPMMREVQKQCQQATMKLMQVHSQSQQQTPQI